MGICGIGAPCGSSKCCDVCMIENSTCGYGVDGCTMECDSNPDECEFYEESEK